MYYDFPFSCDSTNISYTLLRALTVYLTEGCDGLYPATISPYETCAKTCLKIGKRKTCNGTNGCLWQSDGLGGGICKSSEGLNKCKIAFNDSTQCRYIDGCFWKADEEEGGQCKQCSALSKEKTCKNHSRFFLPQNWVCNCFPEGHDEKRLSFHQETSNIFVDVKSRFHRNLS